jgi:hypothetical protein
MRPTFLDTSEQLIMATFRADESIIPVLVNNKEEVQSRTCNRIASLRGKPFLLHDT